MLRGWAGRMDLGRGVVRSPDIWKWILNTVLGVGPIFLLPASEGSTGNCLIAASRLQRQIFIVVIIFFSYSFSLPFISTTRSFHLQLQWASQGERVC